MNSKKMNKKDMLRNLLTTGSIDKESKDMEEDAVEEEVVIDDVADIEVPEIGEDVEETADEVVEETVEPVRDNEPVDTDTPAVDGRLLEEMEALRKEIAELKADNGEYLTSRELHKMYMTAINKRDGEIANKKLMTMLEQLSTMREDFFKLCRDMEKKLDKFSPKDILDSFTAYNIDMENILNDAGVYIGKFDYDRLNTIHQRIVDVIPTDDEDLDGKIAERMSEGYEFEGHVLFKEKVKIYKFTAETTSKETTSE